MEASIKIGGASGYWGDSQMSTPQLLKADIDYLVYDYLAEITMSIMARARANDPTQGYAADFVYGVLKPNLRKIAESGVKVLSNAGGVNPTACGEAVRSLIKSEGLDLKVAVITGDDLIERATELADTGYREMFSGASFPNREQLASVNAYIGAFPVAEALSRGADIVILGRCVDSAVTLGACIHAFGWSPEDLDLLASGSLAGHLIECGPQATGGNYTDWRDVAESLGNIGYPIAQIFADGSMDISKPSGTGGTVTVGTVAEQMLYEIADPQSYILPDVVCDFSQVSFEQLDVDLVRASGAKGRAPTDTYKVCATYMDGYRGTMVMNFYGLDAEEKANVFAKTAFDRADAKLRMSNAGDYTEKSVEILGTESQYGDYSEVNNVREVALKIACKHPSDKGVGLLFKEVSGLGLATPPGLSGFGGGRPKPSPVVRLFSFLIPKDQIKIQLDIDGTITHCKNASVGMPSTLARPKEPYVEQDNGDMLDVPLVKLAWGRSGDKGDKANVGIIARDSSYLPFIWSTLTEDIVASRFNHFLKGRVERFYLPGSHSINFVLHDVLGGGGVASLRADPQGKGYAQLLLSTPISVPRQIAEAL